MTLDLIMPGLSGWEVLKKAKADPELRHIPVVVVSVVAGEGRGSLLGAVDLITKPFEREDLLRVLWRHLGRTTGGRALLISADPELRDGLKRFLKARGLEVATWSDGADPMDVMKAEAPDAVVLDMATPGVDGLRVLGALRGSRVYGGLPLFALTREGESAETVEKLRDLHAVVVPRDDPVSDLDELLGVLFPLAGGRGAERVTDTDRQRVLVIEDDPEIQHILSVILDDQGREVVVSENAADARRELEMGHLDLVILDLFLPDADGRTLLSELRAARETAAVPVVVTSVRATPEIRQECYALGADAFVEKPFDPVEVQADIGARLERQAAAERAVLSDPVTGLLNRAGLEAVCSDLDDEYGIGVIQLDGFGERSERWGWDKSERIVSEVAEALRGAVPEHATVGRLGGADFALLAPGADLESVSLLAEEALRIVRELRSAELGPDETPLTATIGVVAADPGDPFEESLDTARQRIFQARAEAGDHVASESAAPRLQ